MKIRQAKKIGKSRRKRRLSTLRKACARYLRWHEDFQPEEFIGYEGYMMIVWGYPNFGGYTTKDWSE